MYWTQALNRVATKIVNGVQRYGYVNRDLVNNIPGTQIGAADLEMLVEEGLAILDGAGIAPDPTNNAQIIAAIRLFARGQTIGLSASAIVTVPAWATAAEVEAWGAGGGAGGGSNVGSGGEGGGGGAYGVAFVSGLAPGLQIPATLGTPGGGGAPGADGVAGTATSFSGFLVCPGGGLGAGATSAIAGATVNASGVPTVGAGAALVRGSSGGNGATAYLTGNNGIVSGAAGWSFGASLLQHVGNTSTSAPGFNGQSPGQGGDGGTAGGNGGTGASGYMIIRWRA